MTPPLIASIHAGKIAPLGPEGVPSGFVKHEINRSVHVSALGIRGDEQADLSVHGGTEKAVYSYALAHYEAWRADYPNHAATLVRGGFGENLCIAGMSEADLCVGDIHRVGSAQHQVCKPRQPCFKLALILAVFPRSVLGIILFLTGAQLALGSCDFSKNKGERFITLATAAFALWNVGLAFIVGLALAYLEKRGRLRL